MRTPWRHVALATAALSATATQAAEVDWAHDRIQQFLYDVWHGLDFAQPELQEVVSKEDAEQLIRLKDCQLKDVSRTRDDPIALVNFLCGKQGQESISAMLKFQDQNISRIEVVHSVFVDRKQVDAKQ